MRLKFLSTVSVFVLATAIPHVAQAGFEFVAPTAKPAAAPAETAPTAEQAAVPVAPVSSEALPANDTTVLDASPTFGNKVVPLTPVVKSSDALVTDDAPFSAPVPEPVAVAAPPAPKKPNSDVLWDSGVRSSKKTEPVKPVITAAVEEPAKPAITASDLDEGPVVQGFGRQVPMALALQQIVPANYRYSFDYGVDPGQRVSWTGGKPWKAVITELARNNGMNVDIVNNVIAFHRRSPMEVVSAQSGMDTTPDMVQGMPLRPVPAAAPLNVPTMPPSMPAPVTMSDNERPADEPMSLLAPYQPESKAVTVAPTEPVVPAATSPIIFDTPATTAGTDAPAPAREELGTLSDTTAPVVAPVVTETKTEMKTEMKPVTASAEEPKNRKNIFDQMFDSEDDEISAPKTIKNKKILIADEEDMKPAKTDVPPVVAAAAAPVAVATAPIKPVVTSQDVIFDEPTKPTADEAQTLNLMKKLEDKKKAEGVSTEPLNIAAPSLPPLDVNPASGSDIESSQEWTGMKDSTLRQILTDWSARAGVSLVWSSEYDYPLQTDVRIQGTYPDAVRTMMAGFAKAEPRPLGRLFKNKSVGAQPVLVVETQRLTN